MNKIYVLLLTLALCGCSDGNNSMDDILFDNLNPKDLNSCYSPEFGITEDEQFLYNFVIGNLKVDLDDIITIENKGYSIESGSNVIFVYRHLLENSFNIIDDEIEVRILFQVDNDSDDFSISSKEDFECAKCIYTECGIALQTVSGRIDGHKNSDGSWSVEGELNILRFNSVKEVNINNVFIF